jgi:hypothetical protein
MNTKTSTWVTVLLIGSVWGFLEATLGGLLHLSPAPIAGRVMAPIGFAILFWGMKNGLKPVHVLCVSLIAASFKFADPFIFHINFFNIKVINPANAIVMQGLCFAAMLGVFQKVGSSLKKTIFAAVPLFPVSWTLFTLVSLFVFQNTPSALKGSFADTINFLVMGTAMTVLTIALSFLAMRHDRRFLERLPLGLSVASALSLAVMAVIVRAVLG